LESYPTVAPCKKDRETLRMLAGRVREIADLPEMETRRRRWREFNALRPERPMILCFPEGASLELVPESELTCEDPFLRRWEWNLRFKLYWWDHLRDDNVLEPWLSHLPDSP